MAMACFRLQPFFRPSRTASPTSLIGMASSEERLFGVEGRLEGREVLPNLPLRVIRARFLLRRLARGVLRGPRAVADPLVGPVPAESLTRRGTLDHPARILGLLFRHDGGLRVRFRR